MELAVRKIMLEMFRKIILKSPVDTGRFRGNWQVAIGDAPEGTLELDDKTGIATIAKADANLAGVDIGDTIFFANNLPYAMRLEEGYSGQAPAGMVSLTVQEFQAITARIGIELSVQ
jgi:allantoicase